MASLCVSLLLTRQCLRTGGQVDAEASDRVHQGALCACPRHVAKLTCLVGDARPDEHGERAGRVLGVHLRHGIEYVQCVSTQTLSHQGVAKCVVSDASHSYAKNVVYVGQMEAIRVQMEEDLKRDMDEPLDQFNEQFKIVKVSVKLLYTCAMSHCCAET